MMSFSAFSQTGTESDSITKPVDSTKVEKPVVVGLSKDVAKAVIKDIVVGDELKKESAKKDEIIAEQDKKNQLLSDENSNQQAQNKNLTLQMMNNAFIAKMKDAKFTAEKDVLKSEVKSERRKKTFYKVTTFVAAAVITGLLLSPN